MKCRWLLGMAAFAFSTSIVVAVGTRHVAPVPGPPTSKNVRSAQEEDIRELVYRYQFEHSAPGPKSSTNYYYFLAMGDPMPSVKNDPPEAFMKRFAGNSPPVKRVSQCTLAIAGAAKDRETGKDGVIFYLKKIIWNTTADVDVEGGYFASPSSTSGETYHLSHAHGHWTVTSGTIALN